MSKNGRASPIDEIIAQRERAIGALVTL